MSPPDKNVNVKKKTNVKKEDILNLARSIQGKDMKNEDNLKKLIRDVAKLAGKDVSKEKEQKIIDSVKNGNDTLTYTYDSIGNITSISKNGTLIESYTYDYLNQLKTVTRGSDTYEYEYDNGGNILAAGACSGSVLYPHSLKLRRFSGTGVAGCPFQTCRGTESGSPEE